MADTYTTAQGDTWDTISKQLWGNERLMHELMNANPDHQDVVFFSAGVPLQIPEIDRAATIIELPPWKKQ